jgi:hypothetical protein
MYMCSKGGEGDGLAGRKTGSRGDGLYIRGESEKLSRATATMADV